MPLVVQKVKPNKLSRKWPIKPNERSQGERESEGDGEEGPSQIVCHIVNEGGLRLKRRWLTLIDGLKIRADKGVAVNGLIDQRR